MKIKYLFSAILISSLALYAQVEKTPEKVQETFKKLYPHVQNVKWSKENKTEFEAEFKDDGKTTSVVIDKEGKLIETEIDITVSELPKGAVEYVAKNSQGWKITEAAKIVDAKGTVTFEAQVSKGKKNKDIIFTKEGNRLDKQQK